MDKLKECAIAFRNLLKTQYRIILGRKGRKTEIVLSFDNKEAVNFLVSLKEKSF